MVRRVMAAGAFALAMMAVSIPRVGAVEGQAQPQPQNQAQQQATRPAAAQVDLNKATAAELERLPGIGPATAARILEYRDRSGGFKKIEDLMNVQGIGERRFLDLRTQITVTPIKPGE